MAAVKMNSSTNPPAASRKFKFDLDFEEERIRLEATRQAEAMRQPGHDVGPPQSYSEDEMTQARQEAYQNGYDQGMQEAKQSLEQALSTLLDRTAQKLRLLIDTEERREKSVQETALRMALMAVKKFWPRFQESCGNDLIEATLRESLETNQNEARIVLRVHDSMMDSVIARLDVIKEQQAFAGKVIVLADDNLAAGDCKVEWADGGLERLGRALSQQLDSAIERILATAAAEPLTTSDTERTKQ
jgi:flagellar assembly protein FliH